MGGGAGCGGVEGLRGAGGRGGEGIYRYGKPRQKGYCSGYYHRDGA